MKCPFCSTTASRIVETRPLTNTVWRKRECKSCDQRFWTQEAHADSRPSNLDKLSAKARLNRPKFLPR